jgi:diguanylate cyclase (GGDEF)-like protein/PAS domain S-box-containing protein
MSFAALRDLQARLLRFARRRGRFGELSVDESRDSVRTALSILKAQQEATLDGILVVDRDGRVLTCNQRFLEIWGIPPELPVEADDDALLEYAFRLVADRDSFQDGVRSAYANPQEIRENDVIRLNDGRVLSRSTVPVFSSNGDPSGRAWYFRDVTEEVRAEALRTALFQVSEVAHTAPNLDDLYRAVHRIVGELMDATNFYIALYEDGSDSLTFPYFVDEKDERPESTSRRGLTWYVLRTGKPLLANPNRFADMVRQGEVEPVGAPSLDWLGVPLNARNQTIGVIGVQSYSEHLRYGEKEMEILNFVSQHVASAIETKRQEEELRRSKEYSESIIRAANAIIAHLDASGRVQMVNDKAEEVTGYTLAELKGRRWFEFITPPDQPRHLWEATAFDRGRPLPRSLEFTIRTKSGEDREISWHNNEVLVGGKFVGTVCIGIDVTTSKAAEEAIRESEERYRQMFENNPAVKLLLDPETGAIVHGNQAACRFYGYDLEELRSMHIWDINTSSQEELRYEMARAAAQRRNFFVFKHRIASGEVRDVEIHTGPIQDGGRTLLYSIVTDVTDRKRAEEALLESEEKYRNIVRYATIAIYQSDPYGNILTANETMARLLGYESVDELLSLNMASDIYMYSHDRDALIQRISERETQADVEVLWKRKDGSPIWMQLNAHAVRDRDGRVHYEGFAHDISERKYAEEMMRNQSAAFRASMDGIAILSEKGEFIYVNDAHAELYGYNSPAEMVGRSLRLVYDPDEYWRLMNEVMPQVREKGSWRGAADGRRHDGSTFPQEVSLTSLDSGGVVSVVRDTTERNIAEEQIRHLAYHDVLTGLPNRLLFKDRLTVAITRSQREHSLLAVLFLDLDDFKRINDSLGHNTGDHLLQAVAHRIQGCIRDSDTVARLGGDEFTILLPMLANGEDAALIARNILDAMRRPFNIYGQEHVITTSIGISVYPDDGVDTETLIKNADTAMYQAKSSGRDTYQLFNAAISAHALERLALENGLRRAIERQEFRVHYQPILDLARNRIWGMEALVRWEHPALGLIAPGNFIPIAESLNLMGAIGTIVMRTACEQLRTWRARGFDELTLSINISVSQLRQQDCVEKIGEILREFEVPRGSLELEITESGAMQDPEAMIRSLHDLKRLGVGISLDDFGTGHSSLSNLKRFPIDTLKIDQSFIRDLSTDSETAAIVTAIVVMARTLKLQVVAEGVEQEDQRQYLSSKGCDLMQGFLFHRPVPAEEFERILTEANPR